jgi:uncharacterized membrane protein
MKGKKFVLCGFAGWCIEVAFTSLNGLLQKDLKLMGKTSAWMFPIYGMASLIGKISPKISHWPVLGRGLLYGSSILGVEFLSGSILTKLGVCPWNYEGSKYAVKNIIRLDFLPLWMFAGLLYEKILETLNDTF